MADASIRSIVINAPASHIAEVITDFSRYPEWVSAMKSIDILEEFEDGYASQVRFNLDALVMQDEYTLAYEYSEDLTHIEWHLVSPSRMQKEQEGAYDLVDNGDGSATVTYRLAVELGVDMLGMFKRKAEKMIMDAALKDLKRRVEALAGTG
jgi:uncharacterized membrane protein